MLKDKVCIVTGASSGIGRAVALAYAREGAKVMANDTDRDGGEQTCALIRAEGGTARFTLGDVSRPEVCERLVAGTVDAYGRLDVACNNAGVGGAQAPTADYAIEEWQRVLDINLSSIFYCMKYQLPQLLKTRGAIVNMASILGTVGFANAPAYTAAKHGVVGLTQAAAQEYGARGVRINAVAPGFIHTPMIAGLESQEQMKAQLIAMHPAGRLGEPAEVAELVLWLSSPRASFCNGACFPVDGGYLSR